MKILYLITKPDRGGAQTNVLALATGLSAQGHQVTVGTGHQGWLTQELNMDFVIFKHLHRSLNPLSGIFYIFELRRFLNQNHFDLVHFHSSNSLIGVLGALGLADKPKTVATIHGLSILHPGWKKLHLIKTVYARVMKFLLKYFDRVIFVCAADKKFALNFQLVKPEQARMIYNGIDPNIKFLSRSDARAQLGLPEDLFIIGTVARLEYSKNLELLIQTADKLRNHHLLFVILGDGPDRDHLSKIIERQQLTNHIMILNCFPDPKILIKAFNNFIITSRYEGLPYTLLEAGLSQTPIISPDVGGISEVIDQTYKADPDCLARQILALKKTPNSQTQITYQKIIANFSLAKMLAQTIQVYVETMA